MGRRHLSAKNPQNALSHVRTELLSEISSPVLEPSEVCPQNSEEIIAQPPEKDALQPQSVTKSIKPTLSWGKFSTCTDIVRRSRRLQSLDVEPILEDLTASRSENKDGPPARERKKLAGSPLKKRSHGGKLDYLVELLELQGNTIKELSSKVSENSVSNQSPFAPDVRYKSLYIESQKKIDALTEEKRELSQKLEIALIKIDACERGTQYAMDFLDKLKDLVLLANFSRPMQPQTALTQAVRKDLPLLAPTTSLAKKRKR